MSMSTDTIVRWIRDYLVPTMIESGQFGAGTVFKSVEIARLSMAETFMLTICHKIKLTVADGIEKLPNEQTYGIVVKV